MSIAFSGGSGAQQAVLRQAHAEAIAMATAAQAAAPGGGAPFVTWFGSASNATVAARYGEVVAALNGIAWTYDLNNWLATIFDDSIYLSPTAFDATANTATLAPWTGLFMQSAPAIGQRMAALSIVHVAAGIREDWSNPSFMDSAAAAQRYALVDPDGAVTCPRNYMEYAGAITPG